jgi:hypothetical protein
MKAHLVAGLAIAVLFGASLALVHRWTDPAAVTAPGATGAEPLAVAPEAVPAMTDTAGPPARAVDGTAVRASPAEVPVAPTASAPPLADRVTRKAVRKALLAASVQARLARCVDRDVGFGGRTAADRVPRAAPAVLLLELEATPGRVELVGVGVEQWGGVSDQVVACARSALRGQVVAAAGGEARGRLRMPYPLSPRSEARATEKVAAN